MPRAPASAGPRLDELEALTGVLRALAGPEQRGDETYVASEAYAAEAAYGEAAAEVVGDDYWRWNGIVGGAGNLAANLRELVEAIEADDHDALNGPFLSEVARQARNHPVDQLHIRHIHRQRHWVRLLNEGGVEMTASAVVEPTTEELRDVRARALALGVDPHDLDALKAVSGAAALRGTGGYWELRADKLLDGEIPAAYARLLATTADALAEPLERMILRRAEYDPLDPDSPLAAYLAEELSLVRDLGGEFALHAAAEAAVAAMALIHQRMSEAGFHDGKPQGRLPGFE